MVTRTEHLQQTFDSFSQQFYLSFFKKKGIYEIKVWYKVLNVFLKPAGLWHDPANQTEIRQTDDRLQLLINISMSLCSLFSCSRHGLMN